MRIRIIEMRERMISVHVNHSHMKFPQFLFPLLLFGLCCPQFVLATHDVAGELTYEFLDSCTLRVHFSHYVHCNGANGSAFPVNLVSTGGSCTLPAPLTAWVQTAQIDQTPVCPGFQTDCSDPNSPVGGFAQWAFQRDFEICGSNCGQVRIAWQTCCRSWSVGGQSEGWYLGRSVISLNQSGPNSSPRFLPHPLNFGYAFSEVGYSFRAIDPDGDSISYHLDTCFRAAGMPITYSAGVSPSQPFGSGFDLQLDARTGVLNVDPKPGASSNSHYFMAVRADEHRNG